MLVDLTVKEFLNKVAGNDPVPGGGSVAALCGAIASSLAAMVANLTIGKKNYEACQEQMGHIAALAAERKDIFVADIDRDSEAYDRVFACFKMPKATDEEKTARSAVLGALMNVRINLGSLKDKEFALSLQDEADELERQALLKEKALLDEINRELRV